MKLDQNLVRQNPYNKSQDVYFHSDEEKISACSKDPYPGCYREQLISLHGIIK